MLMLSGVGFYNGSLLILYIEMTTRCWKFVGEIGRYGVDGDGEVAASLAIMVPLPSAELRGRGVECVICKEEMREKRDVCQLPCEKEEHMSLL
ncbi:E3 ubiquitin-protein ligase SGR9, amyloplastic [Morella rubra]|uniref:E3 ubiquitin-protein ligase SGR9, amyloplastic n=1 Tax=Morella rubra TaxID=262757 RepID=A0A6A1WPM2_9ROSI|nr:E3 ubiquitin-protein ligase SGR9, amyloplastic [Morella rubra]